MRFLIVSASALLLFACGTRPTQLLGEAQNALSEAALAKKCAPDEFEAAEKMYIKAQKLADAEKYDEAEAAARAAKKLAIKAQAKAQARKDECLTPPKPATDPTDFIDDSGPGVDAQDGDGGGMETVYFEYNSSDLTDSARAAMAQNGDWLQRNPTVVVTIEGHCDKRGSTEYNLALGEKRAKVTRSYLISLGVEKNRLGIVSYGEEQPMDYGDTTKAHGRNRRAEFRVVRR